MPACSTKSTRFSPTFARSPLPSRSSSSLRGRASRRVLVRLLQRVAPALVAARPDARRRRPGHPGKGRVTGPGTMSAATMLLTSPVAVGTVRSSRAPNQSEHTFITPSDCPTNQDHLTRVILSPRRRSMVTDRYERTLNREIETMSRAEPLGRTSRTPKPPIRPNRAPAASRRCADPAPHSARTSLANSRRAWPVSSSGYSQDVGARSIRARRSSFAGEERSDPACRADRGGEGEIGSPGSAPLCERRAPGSCPCCELDASARIARRRSAHRRDIGASSSLAPLHLPDTPTTAMHAISSSCRI